MVNILAKGAFISILTATLLKYDALNYPMLQLFFLEIYFIDMISLTR